MKTKILLLLMAFLMLTSCVFNDENDDVDQDQETHILPDVISYYSENERFNLIIPFKEARQRLDHENREVYKEDTYEVTKQLQSMSANYFSPADYYIQEGQIFSQEEFTNLLRFNSTENPMGLNPSSDESFISENKQEIKQPVIIVTMYEIDYYGSSNTDSGIQGLALALAVSGDVNDNELDQDELLQDDLLNYSENAARKLVSYIRTMPDLSQVPIFIGIYDLAKSDSTLPGVFISSAYFEGNSGQFTRVNQEWVIFPSNRASELTPEVSTEFNILKEQVQSFLPQEQVGVVGKARVIDNKVNEMMITVSTTGKTYLEVQGLAQYAFQLINDRLQYDDFDVLVDIQVLGETVMVIEKKGDIVKMVEW
ncbi:MAG TPA: hypothetical protein GX703_01380 [Erysipelothrix sp.]|jgi:protein involved in sex pheromone biosynthesis|nr:hypothetical protein [Erysipelothrix sp.]